jgi:hypothetical protein
MSDDDIIEVVPEWSSHRVLSGAPVDLLGVSHMPGVHAVRLYLECNCFEVLSTHPADRVPEMVARFSRGWVLLAKVEE